jgi:hypothetical protein
MTTGVRAINDLAKMGFSAWVEGQEICLRYAGPGKPDPSQVRPLLTLVKEHKSEVLSYLAQKPQAPPERILSCRECPWHQANPWTHFPELPAWCGWHYDHLLSDNPACLGWRRGVIPRPEPKPDLHDPPRFSTANDLEERKVRAKGRKLF